MDESSGKVNYTTTHNSEERTSEVSFDQELHVFGVIGAWLGGIGTIIAASVALVLARRAEKVRLNCYIGIRVRIGNSTTQEFLTFSVTNLGERPITVASVGWKIGKGTRMRVAAQPQTPMSADQCPKKIDYGETAHFDVSFHESPNWIETSRGVLYRKAKSKHLEGRFTPRFVTPKTCDRKNRCWIS